MNTELANISTVDNILKTYESLGYHIFSNDKYDYNVNVCTIRSNNQKAGSFDDLEVLFWKYKGVWNITVDSATADPSDLSLREMKNPLGCAIVKPNQYLNSHMIGKHKNKYVALVQKNPITVIRDFDRDNDLDWYCETNGLDKVIKPNGTCANGYTTKFYSGSKIVYIEDYGVFGINHHNASFMRVLETIGLYSEGCCVHNVTTEYNRYINILMSAMNLYGNKFTTTLITENQIRKVL